MLRMIRLRAKIMFRDRTEATLFRPGTVPVPVPVLSLVYMCVYRFQACRIFQLMS